MDLDFVCSYIHLFPTLFQFLLFIITFSCCFPSTVQFPCLLNVQSVKRFLARNVWWLTKRSTLCICNQEMSDTIREQLVARQAHNLKRSVRSCCRKLGPLEGLNNPPFFVFFILCLSPFSSIVLFLLSSLIILEFFSFFIDFLSFCFYIPFEIQHIPIFNTKSFMYIE